jgi:hypothetical protein
MKNLFTALLFLGLINYASAQNTFPAFGNVGIGTVSPLEALHLNGSIRGNQSGALRINSGSGLLDIGSQNTQYTHFITDRQFFFFNKDVQIAGSIGSYDLPLDFRIFNVTRMYIKKENGNVGIGTIVPGSYKLAVAGSIGAWGEVRVFTNGSAFPDYVFDPSYKLPTLEETEKYVKENRHLPEVPSATEIEKEGMSLNGMNVILLKKVEELTLHLIEMKKESEELKKRLEALESKR